jgi:hypothetical protein
VRDADDAKRGAVPEFGSVQFRNRYVETAAQLVFQAADDLAPILQGLRGFDVKFDGEKSNRHCGGQWLVGSD